MKFTPEHLQQSKARNDLIDIAKANGISLTKALQKIHYEAELKALQSELVNLQQWIAKKQMRVAILFEGKKGARGPPTGRGAASLARPVRPKTPFDPMVTLSLISIRNTPNIGCDHTAT